MPCSFIKSSHIVTLASLIRKSLSSDRKEELADDGLVKEQSGELTSDEDEDVVKDAGESTRAWISGSWRMVRRSSCCRNSCAWSEVIMEPTMSGDDGDGGDDKDGDDDDDVDDDDADDERRDDDL